MWHEREVSDVPHNAILLENILPKNTLFMSQKQQVIFHFSICRY